MKILIINTDYPAFLGSLYEAHPGLEGKTYCEQMQVRNDSLFGVADFYSRNLRNHGHEAWEVHANNEMMQAAWAREHGMEVSSNGWLQKAKRIAKETPLRYMKPILRPLIPRPQHLNEILRAQVQHYRPDVVLNQAMDYISDDFLWELKREVRLIVGQIAAPLGDQKSFRSYDLVISSLPNFVEYFKQQGLSAELHRLAFETSVLDRIAPGSPTRVSFVGSLSSQHQSRLRLLETLLSSVDVALWGQSVDSIPKASKVHQHYRGPAWGKEMYEILASSKITLNHHIGIAQDYANNMRLFEATGVGTLLITDQKANLHEMFEPGKEVVAYGSDEECLELIRYYLEHESERQEIARTGQRRTLRDHSYDVRTEELAHLFKTRLDS
jgi:spore maturation protein CgeB